MGVCQPILGRQIYCPLVHAGNAVTDWTAEKRSKDDSQAQSVDLELFKAKKAFSCGIVEGLNNKVKLTIRKSYGFKTFRCTEIALYHVLGKLPEPKLTHRFY